MKRIILSILLCASSIATFKIFGMENMEEQFKRSGIIRNIKYFPTELPREKAIILSRITNQTNQPIIIKQGDKEIVSIPANQYVKQIALASIASKKPFPQFQITNNQNKILALLDFFYKEGIYQGTDIQLEGKLFKNGEQIIYFAPALLENKKGAQAIAKDYKFDSEGNLFELQKKNLKKKTLITYYVDIIFKDRKYTTGILAGETKSLGDSKIEIVGGEIHQEK